MRRHLLGNYGNLFQFEIAVGFRTRREERRSGLGDLRFRKRGVQQQVATILQIAEIHTEWSAIGDRRTDGLLFLGSVGKPDLPRASQSDPAIEFIHGCKFSILLQFFRYHVNASARRGGDLEERLLMRSVVAHNAYSLFR